MNSSINFFTDFSVLSKQYASFFFYLSGSIFIAIALTCLLTWIIWNIIRGIKESYSESTNNVENNDLKKE